MSLLLQKVTVNAFPGITFADCSPDPNLLRAFLPGGSLLGKSFFSLVPQSDHAHLKETLRPIGPSQPVVMATHGFQEDQEQTMKISLQTVFCWIFQPGAASAASTAAESGDVNERTE